MNRLASVIALLLLAVISTHAQEKQDKKADPFDLSATEKLTKELGVPTVQEIATLEAKAKELFDANNCAAAIPALEEYARKSNWLANLVVAGIQPFYNASYDDRKKMGYSGITQTLAPFEQKANQYKTKRNRAMVMQGECYAKTGNKAKAASLFVAALNLLDTDDTDWWQRARNDLYLLIGVVIP